MKAKNSSTRVWLLSNCIRNRLTFFGRTYIACRSKKKRTLLFKNIKLKASFNVCVNFGVYKVTVRVHYVTLTSPRTEVSFNQHTQKCTLCKGGATDIVAPLQNAQLLRALRPNKHGASA